LTESPPRAWRGRLLNQVALRERERRVRRDVVIAARWLCQRGRSVAAAADRLGLPVSTLRRWLRQWRDGHRLLRRRGRPAKVLSRPTRQALIATLRQGKAHSVASLRGDGLPRNAVEDLTRRYRRLGQKRHRRRLCRLQWHVPGAVWAIDGTWLPGVVDGAAKALTVVDLGSRRRVAFAPIPGEQAAVVLHCLQDLIERLGAPLAIKWDNGSGFIADAVRDFCCGQGIVLMHSPVRRPAYNGACEAHNRWAKQRVVAAARAAGSEGVLCREDLAAALTAGEPWPSVVPRRKAFLQCFESELAKVVTERGLAETADPRHALRRSLERVAARRALQLCHILTIRGRDYRW
jgi:transposase InsO family protein